MRRYRLVRELGSGGMGTVYEARMLLPLEQELPVAIKLIRKEHARDTRYMVMFAREALTTLRINHNHPNLVTTYDVGTSRSGRPFLVMELVAGASVRALGQAAPVSMTVVRRIARDALSALAYVHGQGVIHRDISPGNILLSRDGTAKLADFGLSKRVDSIHSGHFRGTAAYASPEALEGLEPTARSDLYSLAAVLYELLVGQPPFGAGDPVQIYGNMAKREPAPLPASTPPDLRRLIAGQLRIRAHERAFASAAEALESLAGEPAAGADDLDAVLDQCPRTHAPASSSAEPAETLLSLETAALAQTHLDSRTASPPEASPQPGRRGRRLAVGAALVAVVLAGIYTARRPAVRAPAPGPADYGVPWGEARSEADTVTEAERAGIDAGAPARAANTDTSHSEHEQPARQPVRSSRPQQDHFNKPQAGKGIYIIPTQAK